MLNLFQNLPLTLTLNALVKITPYMELNGKRLLLLNVFFMSQFNYCQLVWMCHNRTKNNKINKRCLRLIYNDKKSFFGELLEIVLSLFTIEILEPLLLKCIKYIMAFDQLS